MTDEVTLSLAGNELALLPARALWWEARRALVVADVHLGKGAHFRERGFPVPSGDTRSDLARLEALVRRFAARELWILGDLFHSRATDAFFADFSRWRNAIPQCRVTLVRGNHDRDAELADEWRIDAVDDVIVDDIALRHAPSDRPTGSEIAGHLHPAFLLGSARGDRLRTPIFWLRGPQLVLPAFGAFTGGYAIRPERRDRVFAVGPDEVLEVRFAAQEAS